MAHGSVEEFIVDLIKNEGSTFADAYGRKWKYNHFSFYHKDIGDKEWSDGLFCLHLYGTGILPEDYKL